MDGLIGFHVNTTSVFPEHSMTSVNGDAIIIRALFTGFSMPFSNPGSKMGRQDDLRKIYVSYKQNVCP